MELDRLKIGFFNINGFVGHTTYNPKFSEILQKFDILCLSETWLSDNNCIEKLKPNIPPEYLHFHNARKKKHKKSKRNSGGIIILYHKRLQKHIRIHDKDTENMLWIKINKTNTNFDNDLYIGAIYNSPIDSPYTKRNTLDFFETLQKKMTEFPQNDYVIIGGDFNSRTSTIPDYATENEKDANFLNLPDDYKLDKFTKLRNNQDLHTNTYGEKLIDFAVATKM